MSFNKKIIFALILLAVNFNILAGWIICMRSSTPGKIIIQFNREVTQQEYRDFLQRFSPYGLWFGPRPYTYKWDYGEIQIFGSANFNEDSISLLDLIKLLEQDDIVCYAVRNIVSKRRSSSSDQLYHNQIALQNTVRTIFLRDLALTEKLIQTTQNEESECDMYQFPLYYRIHRNVFSNRTRKR
jgi:hypothetical protein